MTYPLARAVVRAKTGTNPDDLWETAAGAMHKTAKEEGYRLLSVALVREEVKLGGISDFIFRGEVTDWVTT